MLCENCIVDASIVHTIKGGVCDFFIVCDFVRVRPQATPVGVVVCVFFKGVRWMPWHTEPMKDV